MGVNAAGTRMDDIALEHLKTSLRDIAFENIDKAVRVMDYCVSWLPEERHDPVRVAVMDRLSVHNLTAQPPKPIQH